MRTFLGKTREEQGVLPAMGVKCEIEEIERSETSENAQTPGCLMYVIRLRVTEPEEYAGFTLRDYCTIGTREDKRAKKAETWERTIGGPGRITRLLKRAGVPIADDDEEWMEAAQGQEICTHLTKRTDENGQPRNRVGLYFRESDPDFAGIGESLEADGTGRRGGRRPVAAVKAAAPDTKARKAKKEEDDEEEEEEEKPGKEEEEEEEPPAKARGRKAKAQRDDDDDEDED